MLAFALAPVVAMAAQGGQSLDVQLVVGLAGDERLEAWAADKPGAEIETLTEVRVGQPAVAQVRVRGCAPSEAGRCRVTVQYVLTGPDGRTVRDQDARELAAGTAAPPMPLAFSSADPTGLYTVTVRVRDLNAKRMVRTERTFGVRQAQEFRIQNSERGSRGSRRAGH